MTPAGVCFKEKLPFLAGLSRNSYPASRISTIKIKEWMTAKGRVFLRLATAVKSAEGATLPKGNSQAKGPFARQASGECRKATKGD